MTGSTLVRLCSISLFLALSAGCRRSKPAGETTLEPPAGNLLLITLDTTRADHLSCYSNLTPAGRRHFKGAKTPHLDALAARGVLFTRATAQAPLTLPSHASIMTGAYPPLHKVRGMEGFVLDASHPTLASIAKGAGFETAAFVGARVLARNAGLSNGFMVYDDDIGSESDERNLPGVFAERRGALVTDRALEWLKQNREKKVFLWAHYYDPHTPYDPPEPYKHDYTGDPYAGEIAYMDEHVGRLLDGLAQLGLESRTLVAVLGDHGESLGEHGELTHGVFLYDSTLRVPFILAGPGIPQAKVIDEQVQSIDLMPTLLAFLNLKSGPEVQGVSLLPLVQQGRHVGSDYSYSETLYPRIYMGWAELFAMRTEKWKLIVAPHPELYNLERDPDENENVISKFRADADRLQKRISLVAGQKGRQEKVAVSPADPRTLRVLQSLGYLSGGTPRQIQLGMDAPDPKDRVEVLKILSQVETLLSRKDYVRATQVMEPGYRLDPTNPRSHLYLATAYEETGQYRRAIQVLQHALDMKLETDKIYSRLGIDYLHVNLPDKAVAAMTEANKINSTDVNNLLNLGMAYLQLGRVDDAEKSFRAAIAQNDRYTPAHNGLGLVAAQRGDTEGARREFEKALAVSPDDPNSLLDMGILYQKMGNNEKALHYLQLFVNKAPREQFKDQIPEVREAIRELKGQ